jgi:hypothetical protein
MCDDAKLLLCGPLSKPLKFTQESNAWCSVDRGWVLAGDAGLGCDLRYWYLVRESKMKFLQPPNTQLSGEDAEDQNVIHILTAGASSE